MGTGKVKSFVKQFVATVTGDDATAQAEKAFRQASSALKTQISSLEGDTIQLEDKVLDAQDARKSARINYGKPITDRTSYVNHLISVKNDVTTAEKNLTAHNDKISFLKAELADLEAES